MLTVMLVSAAYLKAEAPMLVTLDGMEILVIGECANAPPLIPVTPAGSTTAPLHDAPADTSPPVIVKFGVKFDASPVVQR